MLFAMIPFRNIVACCLLAFAPCAYADDPDSAAYVPGTEDVPLMPGLAPAADGTLIFDQPQGRIVEVTALGRVRRRDVIAFYQESLPELGWAAQGKRAFERAGERLSVNFNGHDGKLIVDFMLVPG